MKIRPCLLLLLSCVSNLVWAQKDTLNTKTHLLLLNNIPLGTSSYLVYTQDSTSKLINSADIWVRSVKTEVKNGQPAFHFQWNWYSGDTIVQYVSSYSTKANLAPMYQFYRVKKGILAYNFSGCFMTTADSVKGNRGDPKKKVALTLPVYNWEWDMETFSALPFHHIGQKFVIAFFDPSGGDPGYYKYAITGREKLPLAAGATVDCWVLRESIEPGSYAIYWISDKTREVLKMKELYKGTYRYKVKLY